MEVRKERERGRGNEGAGQHLEGIYSRVGGGGDRQSTLRGGRDRRWVRGIMRGEKDRHVCVQLC